MTDSVLPLLKEAFEHTDSCSMEIEGIIDNLEDALEILPEHDTEIRTSIDQMMSKVFELMDACSAFSEDLNKLCFKYRASYMPVAISPEVDELLEVLARIEARRRGTGPKQE